MRAGLRRLEWSSETDPRLRTLVLEMPDTTAQGIAVLDASLRFAAVDDASCGFIGLPADRLLGVDFGLVDFVGCDVDGRLLTPDEHPAAVALRTGEPVLSAVIGFEPRGDEVAPFRWFRMDLWPVQDGGSTLGVVGLVDDITGSPEAGLATSQVVRHYRQVLGETRENEARYRALAENAADVVYQTDLQARLVWVSPSIHHHLGWSGEEILGRSMVDLVHPDDLAAAEVRRRQALADGGDVGRLELRFRCVDGSWRWMAALSRPMVDSVGRVTGGLTALRDIHDLVAERSRLEHLAAHDSLTGLLNRSAVERALARELFVARGSDRLVGVLYLDLDGFKDVNDEHGHAAGDHVLADLGERLTGALRETDTVARLGGDEFLVVLPGMRDRSDVERRARDLLASLAAAEATGVPRITISLGMAADRGHSDVHEVVAAADAALLRAKVAGKDRASW